MGIVGVGGCLKEHKHRLEISLFNTGVFSAAVAMGRGGAGTVTAHAAKRSKSTWVKNCVLGWD